MTIAFVICASAGRRGSFNSLPLYFHWYPVYGGPELEMQACRGVNANAFFSELSAGTQRQQVGRPSYPLIKLAVG
jgi:hypothetical protein